MAISEILAEQGAWYEAALSLKERRSRGHFSTPPLLVEQILDACGYTADNDLMKIRVLDPACGSGNFLAGAARRLAAFAARSTLSQQERTFLIQRNLWGFDPDPVSCFLAEMQLSAIARSPLPLHIHQADGLALSWDNEPRVDLFLANPPYLAAKNIDLSGYRSAQRRGQADSYLLFLSLGLQVVRPGGWIGLVLPDPVLARTNAAKERARLLNEFSIHHLWHLSDVFAAQVGAVVIIAQKIPPPGTHQVSWVRERWEKGKNILTPLAKPALNGERQLCQPTQGVSQALFLRQPAAEIRYLLSSEQHPVIERLRAYFDETPAAQRRLAPLSEFLSLRRGEELGRTSSQLVHKDLPSIVGAMACPRPVSPCPRPEENPSIVGAMACPRPVSPCPRPGSPTGCRHNSEWHPVLRGGRDMRPYATSFSGWWMAREAITKPLERYLLPKLLVVKSTDRLQAALDLQGHIALQTLYLLYPRAKETRSSPIRPSHAAAASTYGQADCEEEDDLYFFLALLNSRLLRQYVYMLHTAYKWVQPQIEQHVLARLPIPLVTLAEKLPVINRAKLLVRACSELSPVVEWNEPVQSLYEEQERAICALYEVSLL